MLTFIRRNNIVEGPFIVSEIRDRLAKGVITAATPARRDGTNEWNTIGDFFPAAAPPPTKGPPVLPRAAPPAPPPVTPPPLLPIDSIFAGGKLPAMQPDALDRLIEIGNRFLTRVEHRLGRTARPNHTFYAHRVVTTAIQRIRLDLLKGASRELLVDDLHQDCGVPVDDAGLRKLSWWIVFPPYGWDMNDGNDYNFMTIFDQVGKGVVPRDVAIDYFRALLNSQSLDLRNLAARTLMVYRAPPRDAAEASRYNQAMASRDWPVALGSMVRYQDQIEQIPPSPDGAAQFERDCRAWLAQTPPTLAMRTAAENDPEYIALGRIPPSREVLPRFEQMMRRYPGDWILQAIHAAITMEFVDPRAGEARLRELIREAPDSNEGHSRLGTLLKRQGRLAESMAVYEDEVRRWPWNYRAVDSCMWLITEGTTRPNSSG
ncbi:MAG: hypothetical protein HY736_20155 [Verrucomicrobia bacterium]|nr:hypothetical protein [Verrucomicrobiota bacterium]